MHLSIGLRAAARARKGKRAVAVAASSALLTILSAGQWSIAGTPAIWSSPVSGAFNDATKWSTNPNYPSNNTYDAFLNATGNAYTVTLGSATSIENITINSSNATLDQSANLTLSGILSVASGNYIVDNGTVTGGTIQATGGSVLLGGPSFLTSALSGVTLAGAISTNGTLNITNGLSLSAGTLNLTGSTPANQILFSGSQTISGSGQIVFADSTSANVIAPADDASTLTIASGITISANPPSFCFGTIGRSTAPLINNGTITCANPNAQLTITGSNWVNNGTINISAGTLLLGGTTTAANLGTINNTGGTLTLQGTLQNTSQTLDLAKTGSLVIAKGAIIGGAIINTNPLTSLSTNGNPITLDGVTLATNLSHTAQYGTMSNITVKDGITLQNHNITVDSGGGVVATDNSTFGGTGEIIVNNLVNSSGNVSNIGGTSVTIGPNVTITTGTGPGSVNNHAQITTLLNQGTIAVASQGDPMTVTNTVPWVNAGQFTVAYSTLTVAGNWTNTGSMVATTGGVLSLAGTWNNQGTISANNSIIELNGTGSGLNNISTTGSQILVAGTFTTSQIYSIARSTTSVALAGGGVINNTNNTLTTSSASPLQLNYGTVSGGSIVSSDGSAVTVNIGTLDTVTLFAPLFGSNLTAHNLVNNNTINLTSFFGPDGVWTNNGSITTTSFNLNALPTNIGNFTINGGYQNLLCNATTAQLQQFNSHNAHWSLTPGVTLNNSGNNLVLSQAGASWVFGGGEIDGGSITSTDGSQLLITALSGYQSETVIMNGVTLGTNALVSGGVTPTIENGLTLTNKAIVKLGDPIGGGGSGSIAFQGSQILTGNGSVLLQGYAGGPADCYSSTGTLTIDTNVTINNGNNPGTLGETAGGNIVNKGLVSAPTSTYTLSIVGPFTNQGTVEARNGGKISVSSPALLTNLQSGNLIGGNWNVYAGSEIDMPSASITTNSANILLSGSKATFPALSNLEINDGSLSITGGNAFSPGSSFQNDGLISIFSASALDAGSMQENSDGTLAFELNKGAMLNGTLAASGPVFLNGALDWTTGPGYSPAVGDLFTLVNGAGVYGTFSSVVGQPGFGYSVVYSPTTVQLKIISVPEPAALATLLPVGLLAICSRRRRGSIFHAE
jgi:hypothetical protein